MTEQNNEARLDLPRDEMAFRKIYKDLVIQKKITTVFRPGKRLCGDFRGYCKDEIITMRILEQIGADWAKVAPKFDPVFKQKIQIVDIQACSMGELKADDFAGSSPDVYDTESLRYHLGLVYNLLPIDISDDTYVTRIHFSYL